RLRGMLAEAGCGVLLTQADAAARFADCGVRVLVLDGEVAFFRQAIAQSPPPEPGRHSRQLAYIAFTSGSTGVPKGVCIEHRSVMRLVRGTQYASFAPDDVFLQFAPLAFDASTFEIWGCLLNGASLAIQPPAAASLEQLGATLRRENVTTLWLTAGLFHQMVDHQLEALAQVRQVLAGGDVLSPRHVRRLLEQPGERWFVNGYGPTENTTFTCCYRINRPEQVGATVSIGRPIANTQVYLVDAAMNRVPVGVAGELLAGGDGLARGYLNQPERTAASFIDNPFSAEPGAGSTAPGIWPAICSGDLEFLGRADRQVKIRGYRIELGEIEAALAAYPGVRQALVQAVTDESGGQRLYAYLVAGEGGSAEAVRAFLAERLPEYMLPSRIFFLGELPLNANGKVDTAALPREAAPVAAAPAESAASPTEKALVDMWEAVFNRRPIGTDEHFFVDLDGDSLQAALLIGRIAGVFSVDLPMDILFDAPTIAELAVILDGQPG
uniref:non-ribosomal peptide synthetase n=1 Tax=Methylogaea oryzae TaxID=1295382 RepID=UPI000A48047C